MIVHFPLLGVITDMQNSLILAFIALIVPVFIGQLLTENAMKNLDVEEKSALLDSTSGIRKYSLIVLIAFILVIAAFPEQRIPIVAIYVAIMYWFYWKRVSSASLPKPYMRAYIASMILGVVGIILFLSILYDN